MLLNVRKHSKGLLPANGTRQKRKYKQTEIKGKLIKLILLKNQIVIHSKCGIKKVRGARDETKGKTRTSRQTKLLITLWQY